MWPEWLENYKDRLAQPGDYERRFVQIILSRIPVLDPGDVTPQFPFQTADGRQRRIDFMIQNPAKGFLLPIELDGLNQRVGLADQPQRNGRERHAEWNDFLKRQNDIIHVYGALLRFSNIQMLNDPQGVITQIAHQLAMQAAQAASKAARSGVGLPDHTPTTAQAPASSPAAPWQPADATASSVSVPPTVAQTASLATYVTSRTKSIWFGGGLVAAAGLVSLMVLSTGWRQDALPSPPVMATSANYQPAATQSQSAAATPPNLLPGRYLTPADAVAHVGERHLICGAVAGTKTLLDGRFVDLDRAYPNAPLTIVIWSTSEIAVRDILLPFGQKLCVNGTITLYRGRPQVEVSKRDQMQLES